MVLKMFLKMTTPITMTTLDLMDLMTLPMTTVLNPMMFHPTITTIAVEIPVATLTTTTTPTMTKIMTQVRMMIKVKTIQRIHLALKVNITIDLHQDRVIQLLMS
jgi:hypothetical protein